VKVRFLTVIIDHHFQRKRVSSRAPNSYLLDKFQPGPIHWPLGTRHLFTNNLNNQNFLGALGVLMKF